MPLLELRGVRKRFGATIALGSVDLALQPGEVHALIGENGAGKSTLMNIVAGTMRADGGLMFANGRDHRPVSALEARRNKIALIHQELSLAPHLTVAENILMGIEPSRFGWLDGRGLNRRASEVLENFDHPEIRPDTLVGNLSIAARQVVEICRAIAAEARIILMDEPTSSLQRGDVRRLFALIRRLKNDGIGVIYISHFLEEIREIADTYTVLRDGKSVAAGSICDVTDGDLISKMVGRSVENLYPLRLAKAVSKTVLKIDKLSAPPVLRSASFELKEGEILGIAGLMGSGRTEMVRAIFGLEEARKGKISLVGSVDASVNHPPSVNIARGVGYLSEDRKGEGLAQTLSIADNLTMTRFSSCSRFGWLNLTKQARQSEVVMAEVGVKTPSAEHVVSTLSGGNQQKIAIGRLLHQDAEVFLLDEPTRGIDVGSKAQIYEIVAKLAARGKAILFISSYLPELFGMCDRLAIMSRGVLSGALPVSDWTPETVLQAAIGEGG